MDQVYKLKVTSSPGILKTIHHNGSYLLFLGKRKLQNFQTLCE